MTSQEYMDAYSEYAMEQMRRYGIPASITLAQGMLESANGGSQMAKNENNHFGIKATRDWISSGGKYSFYTDDEKNEKFRSYKSAKESFEDHSKFLKNNPRYQELFSLSKDDYVGWAKGLQASGYATDKAYADKLISVIEKNNLSTYDAQVLKEKENKDNLIPATTKARSLAYSMPLEREEFLFVTSPFGSRQSPTLGASSDHKGIDIRAKNENVLATENLGEVVKVNHASSKASGKSLTIEYSRDDGSKVRVTYMHLSQINVKVGDKVNAGDIVALSGNTGKSTGPHLHFQVEQVALDGNNRYIDPAAYLSEIAQKGGISVTARYNGEDLLAKYRIEDLEDDSSQEERQMSPEEWLKKLLLSDDSGVGIGSGDPIMDIMVTAFSSLMLLAQKIDSKTLEESMALSSEAAITKKVDITSLMPTMKKVTLEISDSGKALLKANDGQNEWETILKAKDLNRLNLALSSRDLTTEEKERIVGEVLSNSITQERVEKNFEDAIAQNDTYKEGISIK